MPEIGERYDNVIEAAYALTSRPEKITVEGLDHLMIPRGWSATRPNLPEPQPIEVRTLSALADYCHANRDELTLEHCVAYVRGPGSVALVDQLENQAAAFRRRGYVVANLGVDPQPFGAYQPPEEFLVWLLTRFVDTPARAGLLALVGGLRDSRVRETTDDGYAQKVTTAKGVATVGEHRIENPVELRPFRTFPEVAEQPASPFVLRMRSGDPELDQPPTLALIECDGGAWRLDCVQLVKAKLVELLPSTVQVLA